MRYYLRVLRIISIFHSVCFVLASSTYRIYIYIYSLSRRLQFFGFIARYLSRDAYIEICSFAIFRKSAGIIARTYIYIWFLCAGFEGGKKSLTKYYNIARRNDCMRTKWTIIQEYSYNYAYDIIGAIRIILCSNDNMIYVACKIILPCCVPYRNVRLFEQTHYYRRRHA